MSSVAFAMEVLLNINPFEKIVSNQINFDVQINRRYFASTLDLKSLCDRYKIKYESLVYISSHIFYPKT